MHLGFTGTREGMSEPQQVEVALLMSRLVGRFGVLDLHHGCCVGGDAQAHAIALKINSSKPAAIRIHGHPASGVGDLRDTSLTGFTSLAAPLPPLQRNAAMVRLCPEWVACPLDGSGKGGTWWTIRHAVECGRLVHVVGR